MKATINVEAFKRAYQSVSAIVPARSPKPVLQNVKATLGDESYLEATDLEISVRHDLWSLNVEEPGCVLLGQAFGQILASTDDEELLIESHNDILTVRGLRSEFKLPIEPHDLYPDASIGIPESYYQVGANDLRAAIKRTIFACDVESTRYALGGTLWEVAGESLGVVGSDGRRLARHCISVSTVGKPTSPKSPVIPVKALKLIDRNLPDGPVPISFGFTGDSLIVRTEHCTISSRLVSDRFPAYQDVFPKGSPIKIAFAASQLLAVMNQASIATSEESRGVDFHFTEGLLTLRGQAEKGKSRITMPIEYVGAIITLTIDPHYLADALRAIGEQDVTVELIDGKSAMVLRAGDGYAYVVMPLTRSE